MGKSSAPPPDPRLVEAQIRSMGIQDDAIQRIIQTSEAFAPIQMEQMQFALDASKQAQRESNQDRQYALGRRDILTGLQNTMAADAEGFNAGARTQELKAQGLADVNSAFSSVADQNQRTMSRMGINPNSGRASATRNELALAQAGAQAAASNRAAAEARQEGYGLTDRAANALAGFPTMGQQTTAAGAQYGALGLDVANTGLQGRNLGASQAIQGAASMGSNATSMWNAQANYQAKMEQQGDTLGGILGGVGGVAMGLGAMGVSDRRLKQDIHAVGVDPGTGLTLYEFRYKVDPSMRLVGVMADEVREVMPEAVSTGQDGYDRVDYDMLGIELKEVA